MMLRNTHTSQIGLFLPKVEHKKRLKKVRISGQSRMPDPSEYYNEFANTLTDYFEEFNNNLFIEFEFDYINTGSSKWLLVVMQYLQTHLNENGGNLEVTWKYESDDETIQEAGEVLRTHVSFPFVLKAV
jgi:hypothetical protein